MTEDILYSAGIVLGAGLAVYGLWIGIWALLKLWETRDES